MRLRRLISSGLLLTVLMAPVLGLAICASATPSAKARCAAHCAMMGQTQQARLGTASRHEQAPVPAAPCCERKAPVPVVSQPSAPIVSPVQIALMPAASAVGLLAAVHVRRVETAVTPPLASPLSLLCTLLI